MGKGRGPIRLPLTGRGFIATRNNRYKHIGTRACTYISLSGERVYSFGLVAAPFQYRQGLNGVSSFFWWQCWAWSRLQCHCHLYTFVTGGRCCWCKNGAQRPIHLCEYLETAYTLSRARRHSCSCKYVLPCYSVTYEDRARIHILQYLHIFVYILLQYIFYNTVKIHIL